RTLPTPCSTPFPYTTLFRSTQRSAEGTFAASASAMVEKQLRPRGIDDPRVLRAMAKVQRENFVAKELAANAYEDRPLPIGFGQTDRKSTRLNSSHEWNSYAV